MKSVLRFMTGVLAAVGAFGLAGSAFATDYYWNTSVSSGAWADAANWCSDSACTTPATDYPNATSAVIHFTSDAAVTLSGTFATGAFTVYAGAALTLTGTDATTDKVTFSGHVNLEAGATLIVQSARFAQSGSQNLTCAAGAKLYAENGAYIESYHFYLRQAGGTALLSISGISTVYARKDFSLGGGNSIVIDDSTLKTAHFYAGSESPNGSILFKGKGARHIVESNQYYVYYISNSRIDLNFYIPVGGYDNVPISQSPKSAYAFGEKGKATYANSTVYINVLDDSPAAFAGERLNQTLISWPKGYDSGVKEGNLPYGTSEAAFDIVGTSSTTNFNVSFVGSAERVAVTAEPVEAGVPTLDGSASAFGTVFGIAAGSSHTFGFPAYTNASTGVAASALGWSAFKFDAATGDYTAPYGTGSGDSCAYTHPSPAVATKVIWDLDVGYYVTVTPVAGGTTSFGSSWVRRGAMSLTATPDATRGFNKWIVTDAAGEHVSYEPTLVWNLTEPIVCTPVYSSTFWVKTNGTAEGPGMAESPFATIAQALAAAQPGDTVRIGAGTFEVAEAVALADAKKIVGSGCTGADATILVPQTTSVDGAFVLTGDGAQMSDLVVSGAKVRSVVANAGSVVRNCIIRNSNAKPKVREAAAVTASGGTVVDCVISNNHADATICYGGGVRITAGGLVDRCVIAGNDNGSGTHSENGGGGVNITGGTLRNSLITGNATQLRGAGICQDGGGIVENCTIVANGSSSCLTASAAGVYQKGGTLRNCIIWGNVTGSSTQQNLYQESKQGVANVVTHVDTTPLADGEGNIDAVPSFADAAAGDWRLRFCAAVDASLPLGWHLTDTDLTRVTPRISGEAADLGCYEYVSGGLGCSFTVDRTSGLAPLSVTATAAVEGADTVEYRWYLTGGSEPDVVGSDKQQVTMTLPAGRYASRLVVAVDADHTAEFVLPGGIFSAPPVVYVNGANAGRSEFPYDTPETAASNLASVAEATVAGSEIRVARGDYRFDATFVLSEGRRLAGSDGPAATVFLPPVESPSSVNPLLQVQGAGTVLAGVTFADARATALKVMSGATVTNCVVRGGETDDYEGAAVKVSGGTVVGCVITNNVSLQKGNSGRCFGGGVNLSGGLVDRCVIAQNSAGAGLHSGGGGGVYQTAGTLRNSLVWGNRAVICGTGLCTGGGRVENCTVVSNGLDAATDLRSSGVYLTAGAVVNCIVRDNFNANGLVDINAGFTGGVTNTCAGVLVDGPGNTAADPCFRNPGRGNWRLRGTSPLLDAGLDAGYTGDLDADLDLDGAPRRRGKAIGMGCYEGLSSGLLLIVR